MELTNNLKNRFCKDEKLSIQIYDSPYFEQRLELLGALDKWNAFVDMIENEYDGNEQAFLEEYNLLKDKVIDYIKNSETIKSLREADMNRFAPKHKFSKSDVYKETNIGKNFISIDLRKANFSALVHYSRCNCVEPFFTDYNYENFIGSFTNNKHFINSKYVRQVVFGNCLCDRQVTYERHLVDLLLDKLFSYDIIKEEHVYSVMSDEIILYADELFPCDIVKIKRVVDNFEVPLKLEEFKLGKVVGSSAFVKKHTDGSVDPKCMTSFELPFVMRLLRGEEVQDSDMVFYHEKRLARYLEAPELRLEF